MSVKRFYLPGRSLLMVGLESTKGAEIALDGGNVIVVHNLDVTIMDADSVPHDPVHPAAGASEEVGASAVRRKFKFSVVWTGSGSSTATPPWGPLARACCLKRSPPLGPVTPYLGTPLTAINYAKIGATHTATATLIGHGLQNGAAVTVSAASPAGYNVVDAVIRNRTDDTFQYTVGSAIVDQNGEPKPATAPGIINADQQYVLRPLTSSEQLDGLTIYYWMDGAVHKAVGCVGNMTLTYGPKGYPMLNFEFTGLTPENDVQIVPLPVGIDYSAWQDTLRLVAAPANVTGLTIHPLSAPTQDEPNPLPPTLSSFEINLGNKVELDQFCNYEGMAINDRAVEGTIKIATPTGPTLPSPGSDLPLLHAHAKAKGKGVFDFRHGPYLNRVGVSAPNMQLVGLGYGTENGISVAILKVKFLRRDAGNDEIRFHVA